MFFNCALIKQILIIIMVVVVVITLGLSTCMQSPRINFLSIPSDDFVSFNSLRSHSSALDCLLFTQPKRPATIK